jgi:GSCFA family protein
VQIIVTVSPVSLQATFSGEDVVIANTYSKSVLRAAAQAWATVAKNVHYFPSYEIVQNSDRTVTWEEDLRHVRGPVVLHIMNLFLCNYLAGVPATSSKLSASPNPVPPGVERGKTTVSWSCNGAPDAALYVSRADPSPVLTGFGDAVIVAAGATGLAADALGFFDGPHAAKRTSGRRIAIVRMNRFIKILCLSCFSKG